MKQLLVLSVLAACGAKVPPTKISAECPAKPPSSYEAVTEAYTRSDKLRDTYEQVVEVHGTLHSPDWRVARAARDAEHRGLTSEQTSALIAQACAEAAGNLEFELLWAPWDRAEANLDRGTRATWQVRLLDDNNTEIAPLEVIKDRRPDRTVRADYPVFDSFATPYIVRFKRPDPNQPQILGPNVKRVKVVISGPRGSLKLTWP